jgi:hypothetical protein
MIYDTRITSILEEIRGLRQEAITTNHLLNTLLEDIRKGVIVYRGDA